MLESYYAIDKKDEFEKLFNSYLFNKNSTERIYNSDMFLHFMNTFHNGIYLGNIIDINIKTDYFKIQRLIRTDRNNSENTKLEGIFEKDEIITNILEMFPLESINDSNELISLMFYMRMLTIRKSFFASVKLQVPNLVIKNIFWEYMYKKIHKALG